MSRYNRHRSATERPARPDGPRYQSKRTSSVTKSVQEGPRFVSTRSDEELETVIKAKQRNIHPEGTEGYDPNKKRYIPQNSEVNTAEIDPTPIKPRSNIGDKVAAAKEAGKQSYANWKDKKWTEIHPKQALNEFNQGVAEAGQAVGHGIKTAGKAIGRGAEKALTSSAARNIPAGAELLASGVSAVGGMVNTMNSAVNTLINPDMLGNTTAQGLLDTTQQSMNTITDAAGHVVNATDIAGANGVLDNDRKVEDAILNEDPFKEDIIGKDILKTQFGGKSEDQLTSAELKEYYRQLDNRVVTRNDIDKLSPEKLQEYQQRLHEYSMKQAAKEHRMAGTQTGEALKQGRADRAKIVPEEVKRRELYAKANKKEADNKLEEMKAKIEQNKAAAAAGEDLFFTDQFGKLSPEEQQSYRDQYGNDINAMKEAFYERYPSRKLSVEAMDPATRKEIEDYMENLTDEQLTMMGKDRKQVLFDLMTTGKEGSFSLHNAPPWASLMSGDYSQETIPELNNRIEYFEDLYMRSGRPIDPDKQEMYDKLIERRDQLKHDREQFQNGVVQKHKMNHLLGAFSGTYGMANSNDDSGFAKSMMDVLDHSKELSEIWDNTTLDDATRTSKIMHSLGKHKNSAYVTQLKTAVAYDKYSILAQKGVDISKLIAGDINSDNRFATLSPEQIKGLILKNKLTDVYGHKLNFSVEERKELAAGFMRMAVTEDVLKAIELGNKLREAYVPSGLLFAYDSENYNSKSTAYAEDGTPLSGENFHVNRIGQQNSDTYLAIINQAVDQAITEGESILANPRALYSYEGTFTHHASDPHNPNPERTQVYDKGVFKPLYDLTHNEDHVLPINAEHTASSELDGDYLNPFDKFVADSNKENMSYMVDSILKVLGSNNTQTQTERLIGYTELLKNASAADMTNKKNRIALLKAADAAESMLLSLDLGSSMNSKGDQKWREAISNSMQMLAQARIKTTMHFMKDPATGGITPAIYGMPLDDFFVAPASDPNGRKNEMLNFIGMLYNPTQPNETRDFIKFNNKLVDFINNQPSLKPVSAPTYEYTGLDDPALDYNKLASGLWQFMNSKTMMYAASASVRLNDVNTQNYGMPQYLDPVKQVLTRGTTFGQHGAAFKDPTVAGSKQQKIEKYILPIMRGTYALTRLI